MHNLSKVHEACLTDRKNIDLVKGTITVPPETQKGKPTKDEDGNVVKRGYAKTHVYAMDENDGVLTMLRSAATDGLRDEREDVRKCDKRDYKLPEQGFIFLGNAKVGKAKKAVAEKDQEALKKALEPVPVTPASVDAALQRVKTYLADKDKHLIEEKAEEIDQKLATWCTENEVDEEGRKQKLAEITASYRLYDWAKGISTHTFRRSVCSQLDAKKYTTNQIREMSRHTSSQGLSAYVDSFAKKEVRAHAGHVVSRSLMLPRKRQSSDEARS